MNWRARENVRARVSPLHTRDHDALHTVLWGSGATGERRSKNALLLVWPDIMG